MTGCSWLDSPWCYPARGLLCHPRAPRDQWRFQKECCKALSSRRRINWHITFKRFLLCDIDKGCCRICPRKHTVDAILGTRSGKANQWWAINYLGLPWGVPLGRPILQFLSPTHTWNPGLNAHKPIVFSPEKKGLRWHEAENISTAHVCGFSLRFSGINRERICQTMHGSGKHWTVIRNCVTFHGKGREPFPTQSLISHTQPSFFMG